MVVRVFFVSLCRTLKQRIMASSKCLCTQDVKMYLTEEIAIFNEELLKDRKSADCQYTYIHYEKGKVYDCHVSKDKNGNIFSVNSDIKFPDNFPAKYEYNIEHIWFNFFDTPDCKGGRHDFYKFFQLLPINQ